MTLYESTVNVELEMNRTMRLAILWQTMTSRLNVLPTQCVVEPDEENEKNKTIISWSGQGIYLLIESQQIQVVLSEYGLEEEEQENYCDEGVIVVLEMVNKHEMARHVVDAIVEYRPTLAVKE